MSSSSANCIICGELWVKTIYSILQVGLGIKTFIVSFI